jgi:TusA-related sulfurtransferase
MEDLYQQMDNSLKFPGEKLEAKKADTTSSDAIESEDIRGDLWPLNFVKTKLALEALPSGRRLTVLLGDNPALHKVTRSVAEEGHKIVEQIKTGDHWMVVIEKR